jgi:hypothetical protein
MLESILSPRKAERSPWDMIILGFVVSSIAIWVGHYFTEFIPADPSMLALAITVMVLSPLVYRILIIEEEKDEKSLSNNPFGFALRHWDVITVYAFLFVGLLASFSFWYMMLPQSPGIMPSSGEMFGMQESAIPGVQQSISGQATGASVAGPDPMTKFSRITLNNFKIMVFCFLASFMFGAGGLWLLTWNASVWGVHIGVMTNTTFGHLDAFSAYCAGFPYYSLALALWAIPEGLAYVIAAIAGGIVSVAVSRHHFKSEKFWLTVFDASFLLLIAFFLVVLGAYVEHFFVR